jgi:predicted O-linked N-acetylglucosamine transferase (SPINDLY family)
LFRNHDHEGFEIFCYSSVKKPDAFTERLRSHTDHWRAALGRDDASVARMVREDGIDVLVDLTMHMAGGRLRVFAEKPAPVQICWLAYPGTTGLSTMDCRVTDPFLDPPELEGDNPYAERPLRLPDTFWCYDPQGGPDVNALPALHEGRITFGCLNNFCKINTSVLELWARVLRAVDGSRLLLLAPVGARKHAQETLERAGVDPGRVEFLDRHLREEYLAQYHRIDVCLDSVPYNGHTTSLDAFWMGVPVVTLVGRTVVGRAGLCQAMNLGLPELVATTPDEYVARAVDLTRDLNRLGELRAGMRDRMTRSPLMDAPRFARNIESAYRTAWRRWCEAKGR